MADQGPNSTSRFNPAAWLSWLALAAALSLGARIRLEWPLVPFSDVDTWGYLHPALSALSGHGFQHTDARNFVYPGWVYLWLRSCGDFRAIAIAQHVLGLATGVVLWRVWEQWLEWFPERRLPGWIGTFAGCALVAFYELSTTVVFLEQRIRPEAIFPFFAILAIYLTLKFLRAWFRYQRHLAGAAWGAALIFDAILCYQLKPSFGFAVVVAMLPLLAALVQPGLDWRRRLVLPGAAAVGAVLALLLLVWPEHELAKTDETNALFLPQALLALHANTIRDQMAQDLAKSNPTPFPTAWLRTVHARLDHEITVASAPTLEPYESLGFNPDYLMFQQSFCRLSEREVGAARFAHFCYYYFERAWLHRPGAMLRNVLRQLSTFYAKQCPAFWSGRQIDLARNYGKTVALFDWPSFQRQMLVYPPAREYLTAAHRLASSPAIYHEGVMFTPANTWAAKLHLPLLIALLAGLTIALCLPGAEVRRELGAAGSLALLCFAYVFGNCLTVAVVHSLDIDRYNWNLVIFTILAEAAAAVWCVEGLLCFFSRVYPAVHRLTFRSHADPVRH